MGAVAPRDPREGFVDVIHGHRPRVVLNVQGPWRDAWRDLYEERGCDSVRWKWTHRGKSRVDVQPLLTLPRLQDLELTLRGVHDGAVADCRDLKALHLDSNERSELNLVGIQALTNLLIKRPVTPRLDDLPNLRVVTGFGVAGGARTSEWGAHLPVRDLRLDGSGPLDLDALSETLVELWVEGLDVRDLSALAACGRLSTLWIAGAGSQLDDLRPLAGLRRLQHLTLHGVSASSAGLEELSSRHGIHVLLAGAADLATLAAEGSAWRVVEKRPLMLELGGAAGRRVLP
jgi:hypothetical protein